MHACIIVTTDIGFLSQLIAIQQLPPAWGMSSSLLYYEVDIQLHGHRLRVQLLNLFSRSLATVYRFGLHWTIRLGLGLQGRTRQQLNSYSTIPQLNLTVRMLHGFRSKGSGFESLSNVDIFFLKSEAKVPLFPYIHQVVE